MDYAHPDPPFFLNYDMTPGFKPFTTLLKIRGICDGTICCEVVVDLGTNSLNQLTAVHVYNHLAQCWNPRECLKVREF